MSRRLLLGACLALALAGAACEVPASTTGPHCTATLENDRTRTVCTAVEGEPDPRTVEDCKLNITGEHTVCILTRPGQVPVTSYRCGITDVFVRHAYGLEPRVHNADAADAYCAHQDEVHIAQQEQQTGGPCPLICGRPDQ
jgi:hypothetical protein